MTEQPNGRVIWLTGLAGAGKTSLGSELYQRLKPANSAVVLLDGDVLREVYGGYDGHSRAARLAVAYRNARLCRLLSNQGLTVIIATISMFHEIHAFNREQLAGYVEVFIDVPLSVLEQRDQKQLYSRGATGEAQHVYGVDLQPELPLAPTLRLFNDGSRSIQALADDCVAFLSGHSAHGSPA